MKVLLEPYVDIASDLNVFFYIKIVKASVEWIDRG